MTDPNADVQAEASFDLDGVRDQFPLLQHATYLNSCSYGLLSKAVDSAFQEYLAARHQKGAHWGLWVDKMVQTRLALSQLLQCAPEDVSLSSSLSDSVNSLASALDFSGQRNKVVVTDFDFSTTSHIWLAQQRRGAQVVRAQTDASGVNIPLEQFDALIDEQTKIVSIPIICYRTGASLDARAVVKLAHERGALVFVDGYSVMGTAPISAPELGADFIAGGCLKFLLGTSGLGYMYVRNSESQALTPTATGWFAQENPFAMDNQCHQPASNARRFESGTPSVSAMYACTAGIQLLLDASLAAVERQIGRLAEQIVTGVQGRGWRLVTPPSPDRHSSILAVASNDAAGLVQKLEQDQVYVSNREGNIRIAPHYYNSDEDIDILFRSLERNAGLLET
ncbi:aminotransferase class V-fold PLP-dependent enzyme [Elongatibacter sediminis]|uniref:Aminotransferase class V-fold PLP-dependent enzyme n=1 Tax=Elongatibacter sediminis TaxID=3119006 RepID=A0AAW9RGH7_9GAMM